MKLLPMKKVVNNITKPLNELISNAFAKADTRRYFYNDCVWNANSRGYDATNNSIRKYTIPINGYYTVRAYCGWRGSYGKIVGKFQKGEVLTMNFNYKADTYRPGEIIDIYSSKRATEQFRVYLTHGAIVNGTSTDFVSALAIGGAGGHATTNKYFLNGGDAQVRCNNGIAVGGGGGSEYSRFDKNGKSMGDDYLFGADGGTAYAWGNNVRALGGGGGAGYNSELRGSGGGAVVNDNNISTICNLSNLSFNSIYNCRGQNGLYSGGGNGGCGGGGFAYGYNAGYGLFSDGGNSFGGSARAGSSVMDKNGAMFIPRKRGYFAGGGDNTTGGYNSVFYSGVNGITGGNGGFYGGSGGATTQLNATGLHWGNGGIGTYGFGGNGWHGGDGQLKGGDGMSSGNDTYGGNGLKAGTGTISNGTAIRHKSIVHTLPAFNKTGYNSIVIIEYGISKDNY